MGVDDITDMINDQKRPERGNLTPLELLSLSREERYHINLKVRKPDQTIETGLKPLNVGNRVRLLLWDRKQQIKGGLGAKFKGFAPKWSKEVHTVLKRSKMRRNNNVYTYDIGKQQNYYRHELLHIPRRLDTDIPGGYVEHNQHVIVPDDEEWGNESPPSEDSW